MVADPTLDAQWRFTVDEYELMGQVGILSPDDRTELLDGVIVPMSPIGPRHAGVVERITEALYRRAIGKVSIRVQNPVRLPPNSEPEPDITIARRRRDSYTSAHPTAEDTLLVIEVADTSLAVDRGIKLPIYAAEGVVEVWLVDVKSGVVHVCTGPTAHGYSDIRVLGAKDELVPTAVDDVRIPVAEIL